MNNKVKHISQIAVGDILSNNYGQVVLVLDTPKLKGHTWHTRVRHVGGPFMGQTTDNYFLSPNVEGFVYGMYFESRNKTGKRVKPSTVRDNKLKHHFL